MSDLPHGPLDLLLLGGIVACLVIFYLAQSRALRSNQLSPRRRWPEPRDLWPEIQARARERRRRYYP